jgi:hypothetical protein
MPDSKPQFAAAHWTEGPRGWEIVHIGTRERICADMKEHEAHAVVAILNQLWAFRREIPDIPVLQIAAIWRMIKDNTDDGQTDTPVPKR